MLKFLTKLSGSRSNAEKSSASDTNTKDKKSSTRSKPDDANLNDSPKISSTHDDDTDTSEKENEADMHPSPFTPTLLPEIEILDNIKETPEPDDEVEIIEDTSEDTHSSRSGSSSPLPEGEYEVENILDCKKSRGEILYLIKWKNYDAEEDNTFEPIENLNDCKKIMTEFFLKRRQEFIDSQSEEPEAKRLRLDFVPPDPRPCEVRFQEFFDKYKPIPDIDMEGINGKSISKLSSGFEKIDKGLTDFALNKLDEQKTKALHAQIRNFLASEKMNEQRDALQEWARGINSITQGKPFIVVENTVDLCGVPEDFRYINNYVAAPGILIPDDPPVGCECPNNCVGSKKCCPTVNASNCNYTAFYMNKRVRVPPGTPIYECNKKCSCDSTCPNRVVQDGLTSLRLQIFRTSNGCGWAVKTLEKIRKGSFVCMYVGEIINAQEALKRGQEYDQVGSTYLFDLDINEGQDDEENGECLYTVDAWKMGNVAHFLNHSCDPNLSVYNVWVDCLDPNLPKLALFALKDIPKFTELTFDYKSQIENTKAGEGTVPPIKQKQCLCGSENCRKLLF